LASVDSVLEDAAKLTSDQQLQLINSLWEIVPEEVGFRLHEDWKAASIQSGTAATIPWSKIRDRALDRSNYAKPN
jgi:hypothetical protein